MGADSPLMTDAGGHASAVVVLVVLAEKPFQRDFLGANAVDDGF